MNEITYCKKRERGRGKIQSCLRKIRKREIYCMKKKRIEKKANKQKEKHLIDKFYYKIY